MFPSFLLALLAIHVSCLNTVHALSTSTVKFTTTRTVANIVLITVRPNPTVSNVDLKSWLSAMHITAAAQLWVNSTRPLQTLTSTSYITDFVTSVETAVNQNTTISSDLPYIVDEKSSIFSTPVVSFPTVPRTINQTRYPTSVTGTIEVVNISTTSCDGSMSTSHDSDDKPAAWSFPFIDSPEIAYRKQPQVGVNKGLGLGENTTFSQIIGTVTRPTSTTTSTYPFSAAARPTPPLWGYGAVKTGHTQQLEGRFVPLTLIESDPNGSATPQAANLKFRDETSRTLSHISLTSTMFLTTTTTITYAQNVTVNATNLDNYNQTIPSHPVTTATVTITEFPSTCGNMVTNTSMPITNTSSIWNITTPTNSMHTTKSPPVPPSQSPFPSFTIPVFGASVQHHTALEYVNPLAVSLYLALLLTIAL